MKKIMIVGASSGIGMGVARALASRGVRVALAARNIEPLRRLAEEFPGCVEYESVDVTSDDAPERINRLADRLGGLDLYFHVAGIGFSNPALDPSTETAMFRTNTVGAVRCISAVYTRMAAAGGGHIAVLTSVAGTKGIGELAAYSASKAGLQHWIVAMEQRALMEKSGVTFTDIRPGFIDTPLLDADVHYPLEMSLDYVVPRILRALVRRPRVAVIDWRWNILVGLWRLLPNALWIHIPFRTPLPVQKK